MSFSPDENEYHKKRESLHLLKKIAQKYCVKLKGWIVTIQGQDLVDEMMAEFDKAINILGKKKRRSDKRK